MVFGYDGFADINVRQKIYIHLSLFLRPLFDKKKKKNDDENHICIIYDGILVSTNYVHGLFSTAFVHFWPNSFC